MPLLPGKKNIGFNISELQSTGRPHDQAVAIALSNAYDKMKRKKKTKSAAPKSPTAGMQKNEY